MSNFQIALIIVFGAAIVLAVLIFAGFIPLGGQKARQAAIVYNLEIWGTLEGSKLNSFVTNFNDQNQNIKINYFQKNSETFDQELTEALANGRSPDLFLVSNDNLKTLERRILPISFANYDEALFRNSFISLSNLFVAPTGILALPLAVDPLIMYYNKTLLDGAGIAQPPKYWDELLTLAPKLVKKDEDFNLKQNMVALGAYSNINNAKSILSAIMLQLGNLIFVKSGSSLLPVLGEFFGQTTRPAEAALGFYTEFSNPSREVYSWTRTALNSRESFLAERLVFYFGFGSELLDLRNQNPNLAFDLTKILQNRDTKVETTFGRLYGLAISNRSSNPSVALQAINLLTEPANSFALAQALNLPPARRDLLARPPTSPYYLKTFYESAIIAQGYLDSNPSLTEEVFKEMIEAVAGDQLTTSQAVVRANQKLGGK